jgi:hypothetical protein
MRRTIAAAAILLAVCSLTGAALPEPSLAGYPAPLVVKVQELKAACGAKLISAFRPGARIRGSGHPSLHASKRAVDLQGNAACMYARLTDWEGGQSVDYNAVDHLHLSWAPGSPEWGRKFSHWKPRRVGVGG